MRSAWTLYTRSSCAARPRQEPDQARWLALQAVLLHNFRPVYFVIAEAYEKELLSYCPQIGNKKSRLSQPTYFFEIAKCIQVQFLCLRIAYRVGTLVLI